MKNRYIKKLLLFFIILLFGLTCISKQASANSYDWLESGTTASDPFGEVNKSAKSVGGSAFEVARNIAFVILAIVILIIGVNLGNKNSKIREETKEHMKHFMIGAIIVFGILVFASIAQDIGKAIATGN